MLKQPFPNDSRRVEKNVRELVRHANAKLDSADFDTLKIANMPHIDIRTKGAREYPYEDNAHAIQEAIESAYTAGVGAVYVPDGVWNVGLQHWSGLVHYGIELKSNVHIIGGRNAVIRLKNNSSTAGNPKTLSVFGSMGVVQNSGFDGLIFDFNKDNNSVGGTNIAHAAIAFIGELARGNDIRIVHNTFMNSQGGNIILPALAMGNSSSYVLGSGWWILGNRFHNNGLGTTDLSCIFGWCRDMMVYGNIFSQTAFTNHACPCELHGAGSSFIGNTVHNFALGQWIGPNFSEAVENCIVSHNIFRYVTGGIRFWRNYNADATELEVRKVIISDNLIELNDENPGTESAPGGVQIITDYSIEDVDITGNLITRPSGSTYTTYGVVMVTAYANHKHNNIRVENNTIHGVQYGVLLSTESSGDLGNIEIRNNSIGNLRANGSVTNPVGIRLFGGSGNKVDRLSIRGNGFFNQEAPSNATNVGISLEDAVDYLDMGGNSFQGMGLRSISYGAPNPGVLATGDQAHYVDPDFDDNDVLVTAIPSAYCGIVRVRVNTITAIYRIDVGGLTAISAHYLFTTTKDNAGTVNVYIEGGVVKVQNKLGASDIPCYVRAEPVID